MKLSPLWGSLDQSSFSFHSQWAVISTDRGVEFEASVIHWELRNEGISVSFLSDFLSIGFLTMKFWLL